MKTFSQLYSELKEERDYKAEYLKMYGGSNPTPKQKLARKKKTARKRILRQLGREGKSNDGKEIDHKDGNALNNSKGNIRLIPRYENRSRNNNKWRTKKKIQEAAKATNWVRPSDAMLKQEYEIEYKKHLVHELNKDAFPNLNSFLRAAKEAEIVVITKGIDSRIMNRSRTKSMASLLQLIKTYRSYPKFRNEKSLKGIEDALLAGKPMDMPIVVKDESGLMRVFSGNTRMDIAFMNGIQPKVLMIELPKGTSL